MSKEEGTRKRQIVNGEYALLKDLDKIIKYFFRSLSEIKSVSRYMPQTKEEIRSFKLINKKPITPSTEEITVKDKVNNNISKQNQCL